MASIKDLGNGRYRVFVCNGFKEDGTVNRTSKTITAKSKRDAEKQAAALEVDFKRGVNVQPPAPQAYTFSQLVEKWRELKKSALEHKTQVRYEQFIRMFTHFFLDARLQDITPLKIQEYLQLLKEGKNVRADGKPGGYSEKTVQAHYRLLNVLMKDAVIWDMIDRNPCKKVETPKVHRKEAKYYDDKKIEILLDKLDLYYKSIINNYPDSEYKKFLALMHKTYVWLALASACRRSEVLGMTVDNVDFKNNTIRIERTCKYAPEKGIYFTDHLKNGAPAIEKDMPQPVMELLKVYVDARNEIIRHNHWHDSSCLFISLKSKDVVKAGGPMMPDTISQWFTRFLVDNKLPKITLHEVRHSSISYLINKGIDIKMVADRAGHQSTLTTEMIYGHIYSKSRRAVADEYCPMFSGREMDVEQ